MAFEVLRYGDGVEHRVADAKRCPQPDASGSLLFGQIPALISFHEAVHLAKRRHPGDRLLPKRPSEGNRAEQFTIQVNRTAAHTRDDTGLFQTQAGKAA